MNINKYLPKESIFLGYFNAAVGIKILQGSM
jgi:hypothetical protein